MMTLTRLGIRLTTLFFENGIDSLYIDYATYEIIEVEEIPEWAI